MNDKEAIEMMTRCIAEMQSYRAQIDKLSPKAEAYDLLRDVVDLIPKRSQGYGEDLVWRLKKKISELEANKSEA